MCLDRPIYEKPCEEGYKVFTEYRGHVYSNTMGRKRLPLNKWLDEKDHRSYIYELQDSIYYRDLEYYINGYPMGWHVFHKLEDAKRWISTDVETHTETIRKVMAEEPVVVGLQEDLGWESVVTVCKKIKILEEVV